MKKQLIAVTILFLLVVGLGTGGMAKTNFFDNAYFGGDVEVVGTVTFADLDIVGDLNVNGEEIVLDGSTFVHSISAGYVGTQCDDIRFGLDADDYIMFVTSDGSANLDISHPGNTGALVTWLAGGWTLTGNFATDSTTALLDGSTSVRGVSAGFVSLESSDNDIRFGYNATDYMKFAVTQTSSNVAITHTGTAAVTWVANTMTFTTGFEIIGSSTLDDVSMTGGLTVAHTTPPDIILDNTTAGSTADSGKFYWRGNSGAGNTEIDMSIFLDVTSDAVYKLSFLDDGATPELASLNQDGDFQIDGDFEVTGDKITFGTNGATIENTGAGVLTITETSVNFSENIAVEGTANLDDTDIDGTLDVEGTTALLTCSTSVINYTPDFRIGYDATAYMKFAVIQTSGAVAITHIGTAKDVTWAADSLTFTGIFEVVGASSLVTLTLSDVLTFSGGGTIDNTAADTLTAVETNIILDAVTLVGLEAPNVRLGLDASWYMDIAVTQTSGAVAITHTGGTTDVTWTANSFDFNGPIGLDATTLTSVLTFSDGATIDNTDADTLTLAETNVVLDAVTLASLEAPNIRFRLNASDYVNFAVTQTSSNLAITHSDTAAVTWTADSFDFIGTTALDETTFGANAGGNDVTFYGAVASYKTWWDANADSNGTWFFGADDYGVDVVWYGQTQTESVTWDASADTWYFGASDGEGVDITARGETAGAALDWDASDDALELDGTANITHKDAVGAGVLFLTIATGPTYLQTASATVLQHGGTDIEIPGNADIEKIEIVVTTAYDGSGNDTMDVGISTGAGDAYANDVDVSSAGYLDGNVYTNLGDVGGAVRKLTAQYTDANTNASEGACLIYIYWRNY